MRKLLILCLVLLASPAMGQAICTERDKFVLKLKDNYKETRQVIALVSNGHILEVFVSPSGDWTMLVTQPNGTACVISTGEAWEALPEIKHGTNL